MKGVRLGKRAKDHIDEAAVNQVYFQSADGKQLVKVFSKQKI